MPFGFGSTHLELSFLFPGTHLTGNRFQVPRERKWKQLTSPSHKPSCHLPAGSRQRGKQKASLPPTQSFRLPNRFYSSYPPTKICSESQSSPQTWGLQPSKTPTTSGNLVQRGWQGQAFHDTSSLEFTAECPTASACYNARAVPQILRDLPAVEGKPARHTSIHPERRQEQWTADE